MKIYYPEKRGSTQKIIDDITQNIVNEKREFTVQISKRPLIPKSFYESVSKFNCLKKFSFILIDSPIDLYIPSIYSIYSELPKTLIIQWGLFDEMPRNKYSMKFMM
jgi:hypothetical protein